MEKKRISHAKRISNVARRSKRVTLHRFTRKLRRKAGASEDAGQNLNDGASTTVKPENRRPPG